MGERRGRGEIREQRVRHCTHDSVSSMFCVKLWWYTNLQYAPKKRQQKYRYGPVTVRYSTVLVGYRCGT